MDSAATRRIYDSVPLQLGNTSKIRVVTILPCSSADASDAIACEFRILDLGHTARTCSDPTKHVPSYTALSYTWGLVLFKKLILLGGEPFLVQDNLWRFLNRARIEKFTGYLWIDALCIDQSTVGERNHQVSMMGEIYKRAESVLVWLCPVTKRVEDAMRHTSEFLHSGESAQPKPKRRLDLIDLLGRFGRDLQCSEPRDRVYALLSLLSPGARAHLAIEPDYSKSPLELLGDIKASFLERSLLTDHETSLEVLRAVRDALKLHLSIDCEAAEELVKDFEEQRF
ncbi:heterokaryon incompatibility protein-domain-containing protein [Phaeosphaeria sp. MPI-PUGE-AT-0046c]|nr:heterokaryon incompatibility protein-domain-containing protein [Phaeosphaeria sp. MPI-PUGE-AT-0046c]